MRFPYPSFTRDDPASAIAFESIGPDLSADRVPIMALSGGPGSDRRYLRVGGAFDLIAARRSVIFHDQRGTGRSAEDDADTGLDSFVADMDAVRRAAGAERVDLLGHSSGGFMAMAYALAHPERVRALVLVSTNAPKLADTPQLMAELFPEHIQSWIERRAELTPRFSARLLDPFHRMEFLSADALALYTRWVDDHVYNIRVNDRIREAVRDLDMSEGLRELPHPALVIHGRWDAVIAPRCGYEVHKLLRDSRFHVFERSGHSPFVEEPVPFAGKVLEFLDSIEGR